MSDQSHRISMNETGFCSEDTNGVVIEPKSQQQTPSNSSSPDLNTQDTETQLPQQEPPKTPHERFLRHQKTFIIFLVTVSGFLGPVAGNIYIPLLPLYRDVFATNSTAINGTVSVFMFTFGVAPLFWASLSDKFGRRVLFLASLPFYVVSAILLASVPPNIVALYILRFVQAFGASSLMSLGAATITDLVERENRAKAISYFLLGPQLGPIVGLVLSLVGASGQWRWTFGILAIFGGLIFAVVLFCLPETNRNQSQSLEIPEEKLAGGVGTPEESDHWFLRPKELFKFSPPNSTQANISTFKIIWTVVRFYSILWSSVIGAFLFASFYSLSVSFSTILKTQYSFSQTEVSVSYFCPSVGLILGSVITGRISDKLQLRGTNPDRSPHHPERRLMLQSVGLLVCIGGLCCYGWAIEGHWHVATLFVFAFLISFGMSSVSVINMTYVTECPTGYTSTNVAVGNMARNLAAGVASLIIDKLCGAMGYGWYFTGLCFLNVVSLIMSVILCKYGHKWNQRRINREN